MTLKDFISEENIHLNENFSSWQDAVRFAGNMLIGSGSINERYREDMVKMVETNGPYIVIMPGVALAHARPNGNVFKNQVALLTIPQGVNFGNKDNDPVHYLFAIAARTNKEHLVMFKAVAEFISEEKNLQALQEAVCLQDIEF
jgi:PTS system ascorbate-specific IIA component